MLGVIEFDVEALLEFLREGPHRRRSSADARMTNRAHRHIWRRELRQMATGAVFVSGKGWLRRVIIPVMAICAGNTGVALAAMKEFRVIEFVTLSVRGRQ